MRAGVPSRRCARCAGRPRSRLGAPARGSRPNRPDVPRRRRPRARRGSAARSERRDQRRWGPTTRARRHRCRGAPLRPPAWRRCASRRARRATPRNPARHRWPPSRSRPTPRRDRDRCSHRPSPRCRRTRSAARTTPSPAAGRRGVAWRSGTGDDPDRSAGTAPRRLRRGRHRVGGTTRTRDGRRGRTTLASPACRHPSRGSSATSLSPRAVTWGPVERFGPSAPYPWHNLALDGEPRSSRVIVTAPNRESCPSPLHHCLPPTDGAERCGPFCRWPARRARRADAGPGSPATNRRACSGDLSIPHRRRASPSSTSTPISGVGSPPTGRGWHRTWARCSPPWTSATSPCWSTSTAAGATSWNRIWRATTGPTRVVS